MLFARFVTVSFQNVRRALVGSSDKLLQQQEAKLSL